MMRNMNRIMGESVKKQIEYPEGRGGLESAKRILMKGSGIREADSDDRGVPPNDDESPFYPSGGESGTFVLYLEPILNPYYQSYQNIITLNVMPPGPLCEMVTMINVPKLSPFQAAAAYASPFYTGENCIFVLLRYKRSKIGGVGSGAFKNAESFMGADDIPAVFSYLLKKGYTIDTSLSKMMYQSRVEIGGVSDSRLSGDRKMIAMVTRFP
jgi:hypothetical protein